MATKAAAKKTKNPVQTKHSPSAQLDLELAELQGDCDSVEKMRLGYRKRLYQSIASVYYWWRKASAQKGYLEQKINEMGGDYKSTSKHGYNFSPVLQIIYGNVITPEEITRRSHILNLLDAEYKKKPKMYGSDVVKLANHIQQSGGVTKMIADSLANVPSLKTLEKLAKQQSAAMASNLPSSFEIGIAKEAAASEVIAQELNEAEILAEVIRDYGHLYDFVRYPKLLPKVRLTAAIRQAKLAADAEKYWKKHGGLGLIDANFGFDTDTSNFGLAVVKRDATGVSLIDSFIDSALIKQALAIAYEKQYPALPASLRCMYEVLKTQLLPDHVASNMKGKWDSGDEKKLAWERRKKEGNVCVQVPVKAMPRLVHTGNANLFILSPIATNVGVCTMVAPSSNVMEKHEHDVFLLPRSKASIEQLILNSGNMNCYRPANPNAIQVASEPYSHRIQLTSVADVSDFYFVDFYPFTGSSIANYGQAVLDTGYEKNLKTKIQLPRSFVHGVAKNGADKWLAGKGNHANRETNRYTQLTLSSKSLRLDFDYKDGKALAHFEFQLPITTKLKTTYKQKFVCLDLMPVLSALGALQLTTDVQLLFDENVAVFKFSTDAGDFVIAVPTCDNKGKRVRSAAFTKYMPNVQPLTEDERMDIALERYYARNPDGLLIDLDFKKPKQVLVYD
jgi:hypothetical protein